MAEGPRYGFHPLERRGLLLGLDAGQMLTIAAAVVVGVAAHAVLGGSAGVAVGVLMATAGATAALWTTQGSPLGQRMLVAAAWLLRRGARPRLDDTPRQGRGAVPTTISRPDGRSAPRRVRTAPPGVDVFEDRGFPGDQPLGVVRDRRAGVLVAVMPVGGCSFGLLDPVEQGRRLEGWRQVLGAVARPGSPVSRLQWVQRSWMEEVAHGADAGGMPDAPTPRQGAAPSGMVHHNAWLVLAVRAPAGPPQTATRRPGRAAPGRGVTELRRELRFLEGQLRAAGLDPGAPLDGCGLRDVIARPVRAAAGMPRSGPGAGGDPWPLGSEEHWSAYRADGTWHATYWIAEWPRVEVGPDFLAPLLVGPASAAVSVVMAPVPADKARREVRSARTADVADAQLRARAGFLQSARRERESEGVVRREAEMAEGHEEFRFSGYLTVSAADREGLAAACAEVEHAAQSARLEIRRLFGRQAEAFTWTLPLGRGLR